MPQIAANGIRLEYESFGPDEAPAVLLIMGLGAPLTRWPEPLCHELVGRGFRAVRFDNRDVGRSTKLDAAGLPELGRALREGRPPSPIYTLEDMAADSLGLLDALGIAEAHVVGASMGGAIAQIVAADHPRRVRSLTSIMSSSGNPMLPPPTPAALAALFAPLPPRHDADSIVADAIRRQHAIESPGFPTADADLRAMFKAEYERGFNPPGVARQLAALLANGDRRPRLKRIEAPTVVLHGRDDPLIPVACGRDVAANVRGAEMREIAGMGHDFPRALTAVFADAIEAAARRAGG